MTREEKHKNIESATYLGIIEYFGIDKQLRKLQEEIDEFKKEVILYSVGKGNIVDLIDEYVDVNIVLRQFKEQFKITDEKVSPRVDYKLNRTLERIKSGYYD